MSATTFVISYDHVTFQNFWVSKIVHPDPKFKFLGSQTLAPEFEYRGQTMKNGQLSMQYTLGPGHYRFLYNDSVQVTLTLARSERVYALLSSTEHHEELRISIAQPEPDAFQTFQEILLEVLESKRREDFVKVHRFRFDSNSWEFFARVHARPLDTIYLPESLKSEILSDLADFYSARAEYVRFGMPYKRVYLFVGPPGVGKTSLILALASRFQKEIYMIHAEEHAKAAHLAQAIQLSEEDSFFVIEDADVLARTAHFQSMLLNTLDGLYRREGMVVFLTTNELRNMDPALRRPGRIDKIFFFHEPKKREILSMFTKFFPDQAPRFPEFFEKLKLKLPSLSIPVLQQFFFAHRKSPDIVRELDSLETEQREQLTYFA